LAPNLLRSFIVRTLLWLPVAFAAWFYMAIVITWPLTALVDAIMVSWFPEIVTAVKQQGYRLDVITDAGIVTSVAPAASAFRSELVFSLNPLIYGYCLPLFTALALATPLDAGKYWRWCVGLLILYPIQAWGVCFDISKTLLFGLTPEVTTRAALSGWQLEAVALGYQFGYLVLPAVAPLVLWLTLYRSFVIQLAPVIARR